MTGLALETAPDHEHVRRCMVSEGEIWTGYRDRHWPQSGATNAGFPPARAFAAPIPWRMAAPAVRALPSTRLQPMGCGRRCRRSAPGCAPVPVLRSKCAPKNTIRRMPNSPTPARNAAKVDVGLTQGSVARNSSANAPTAVAAKAGFHFCGALSGAAPGRVRTATAATARPGEHCPPGTRLVTVRR